MNKYFKAIVEESTDESQIGVEVSTNLKEVILPNGRLLQIKRRMHVGDGVWHLWDDIFKIVVKEINTITSYQTQENKIVQQTIKRGEK